MEDDDNPYISPETDDLSPISGDGEENVDPRKIGKARQVPTVATLMIVHGILMFVSACCIFALIFFVPHLTKEIDAQLEIQR